MNAMNMGGMNAAGGAVGKVPMANNPRAGAVRQNHQDQTTDTTLNTYIYDHFLRCEKWDIARAIYTSGLNLSTLPKSSPNRRNGDGNAVNGVDSNSMDTDAKDDPDSKRPDDLPAAKMPPGQSDISFLADWWSLFMGVFRAQRSGDGTTDMHHYVQQTHNSIRNRQDQQQQMMRLPNGINPTAPGGRITLPEYQNMIRMHQAQQKTMNNAQDMQRAAATNRSMGNPNQLHIAKMQQMRRDGSDVDINGQPRPQSPASAENAPSPSKRPRLDGAQMNGDAMRPNGINSQMTNQQQQIMQNANNAVRAQQLLMQNNISVNALTPGQFNQFQSQPPGMQSQTIQMFQNKMYPNSPARTGPDGQPLQAAGADFHQQQAMRSQMNPGAAPGGGTALQDYQLQLILLEQQNKKRLQQARQDQAAGTGLEGMRPDQAGGVLPSGPQGQGNFAGLSPGSRNGNSPNPSEQMKRGTPKMNQQGVPGSPLPDGSMPQHRDSPNGPQMVFNNAGGDPNMMFYPGQMKNEAMMGPNGVMRAPNSHPSNFPGGPMTQEAMARARSQMQGQQNWQQNMGGQPMMQNPSQGGQPSQPQQMGTPRQNNMPPPQAVPTTTAANATNAATNNRQTSSPQSTAAPPTPQPTTRAAPKANKKAAAKKNTKKGANNTTGATPSAESAEPPTPTPATPVNNIHPSTFNGKNGGAAQGQAGTNGQGSATAPAVASAGAPPPPDPNGLGGGDPISDPSQTSLDFDFAPLDGDGNVFSGLDFDSFLDNTNYGFDSNNPMAYESVETGTGDM